MKIFSGREGEGKRKPYSCNQDFAERLEPKVKMIRFKKMLQLGGMMSKLM